MQCNVTYLILISLMLGSRAVACIVVDICTFSKYAAVYTGLLYTVNQSVQNISIPVVTQHERL